MNFSRVLYKHRIISDETMKDIKEDYKFAKEHENDKNKDDYDIEI